MRSGPSAVKHHRRADQVGDGRRQLPRLGRQVGQGDRAGRDDLGQSLLMSQVRAQRQPLDPMTRVVVPADVLRAVDRVEVGQGQPVDPSARRHGVPDRDRVQRTHPPLPLVDTGGVVPLRPVSAQLVVLAGQRTGAVPGLVGPQHTQRRRRPPEGPADRPGVRRRRPGPGRVGMQAAPLVEQHSLRPFVDQPAGQWPPGAARRRSAPRRRTRNRPAPGPRRRDGRGGRWPAAAGRTRPAHPACGSGCARPGSRGRGWRCRSPSLGAAKFSSCSPARTPARVARSYQVVSPIPSPQDPCRTAPRASSLVRLAAACTGVVSRASGCTVTADSGLSTPSADSRSASSASAIGSTSMVAAR